VCAIATCHAMTLAEMRKAFAELLVDRGIDRARAIRLAERARAVFAESPSRADTVREIDAWLASQGAARPR
jgi:hypothetical protein